MRRALSILLVLLFGAGPLSFAFGASDDASLPACCRRLGAHHCAMTAARSQDALVATGAVFKAPSHCPQYPLHANARTTSFAAVVSFRSAPLPTERDVKCAEPAGANFTGIHLRTPFLRGPPTLHLS